MRTHLASDTLAPSTKVLILGERLSGKKIAEEMQELGIEPIFADADFPGPTDPNALEKLRAALLRFRGLAGPEWEGESHLVHPGASFWAERPELVQVGQELGLTVVAPPIKSLSLFSNRLSLLALAHELKIPHLVMEFDPFHSRREIERWIEKTDVSFPLVLKSVRGVGGIGLLAAHDREDLGARLPLWLEQLQSNFGESIFFIERYLEGARQVSFPFVRFKDGTLKFFPPIDVSLQCRYRKLVEFCGEIDIQPDAHHRMIRWSTDLLEKCGYVGIGMLDFALDGSSAFLLGGSPRLTTSFPLWEKVAGTHATAWQIAALKNVVRSADLPKLEPDRLWSQAMSMRLYAEDLLLQLPQPGEVREATDRTAWKLPGAVAELHLGVKSGDELHFTSDPLMGWVLVGSPVRRQTIQAALFVLQEIWIAGGVQTNERFLIELLNHSWVKQGMVHAGFVDEEFIPEIRPPDAWLGVFATVCSALLEDQSSEKIRWIVGDRRAETNGSAQEWIHEPVYWERSGWGKGVSGILKMPEEGRPQRCCAYPLGNERWRVRIGSWTVTVRKSSALKPGQVAAGTPVVLPVTSLTSGKVYSLHFRTGAKVPAHRNMILIRSMRMLIPHALPLEVKISRWLVTPEQEIFCGQVLAECEKLS